MDVWRSLLKDPSTREAFMAEVNSAKGMDPRFDVYLNALEPLIEEAMQEEFLARPRQRSDGPRSSGR